MNEQNRYPYDRPEDADRPSEPRHDDAPTGPVTPVGGPSTGAYAEHTRPLPPFRPEPSTAPPMVGPFYGSAGAPPAAPGSTATAQRSRGLTAAVLVGALVLGGAAGVGGSAAYHAFEDDPVTTSTSGTSGDFQPTKNAAVEDGTVEKVANAVLPSVVKVNVTSQSGAGSGSGIVLSRNGEILTNNHVVAGVGDDGSISVNFNDGTTKKATVVGTDPLTDVAVIKVASGDDLVPAPLGKSGTLRVGQTVVAVGSPYGLNATVTSGIVSALNRPVSVATAEEQTPQDPFSQNQQQGGGDLSTTYPAIQTDAAINPGNSGGPLVDLSGRVVGINSSIRTASSGSSFGSDTGGSIGLGFAIPIDEVLPIVNQITEGDKPTHARLGVSVTDASGGSLTQGALLRSVEGGSAGDDAGLKTGDVITKVDDQVIDSSESLVATIRGHRPGEKVTITYVRGGKTSTVTADLASDENTTSS
jgi:putative serine protease PepD